MSPGKSIDDFLKFSWYLSQYEISTKLNLHFYEGTIFFEVLRFYRLIQ